MLELSHLLAAIRLRLVDAKLERIRKQIWSSAIKDSAKHIQQYERYFDKSIRLRSKTTVLKRKMRERDSYLLA